MIMTKFVKSNFEYRNGYLHYNTADGERKFVARFKRGPITKAKFQAALIKHYDVDTYFARLGGAFNPYGHTPFGMMMYDGILCRHYKTRELILDGKAL